MLFAHDTEDGLRGAAALVNSDRTDAGETLATVADLDEFVTIWNWTGSRRRGRAELTAVRALRPRLRRLWYANEDEAVRIVNTLLRAGKALPQLVTHDSWGYHVHATAASAPLARRMAVDAAMAFADLIRIGQLDRLAICAAPGCRNVLVDLSRNRSRRFCDAGCGNRLNVAAYRDREARRA